ncbi:hypothetical protein [Streptomyces sporangiiformans]|uniref:hypothetical protein n=1 Tax=Streptomyces sporangiiformans TaxID=2315329 RepID=UPI0013C51DB8|nr:hypothetical protein [Streptomyces sporangiiformans]
MSNGTGAKAYFSGYGERVIPLPKELRRRPVVIETWGWIASLGFEVIGVTEPRGRYTERGLGSSGIGRERGHILLAPGECESVRIQRGWKMRGRWKIRFLDAMSVGELPREAKGGVSRVFQRPEPGTRLAVEFGDKGGRLAIYNEEGRCVRVLCGRSNRFRDVVVVPDAAGVLAVEGETLKWGSMFPWSLKVQP